MLDRCYNEGYTHIHAETPGPVGLAALAVARILRLPFSGTYHTALPQTFRSITGDAGMEDTIWRYLTWFYSQMDAVYAPSEATARELVAKGVDRSRVRVQKWGVDTERFHPGKGNGFLTRRYGLAPDHLKLLYVGRVSKEKNLHVLSEIMRKLADIRNDVALVVIGDGPYLAEMKRDLNRLPVIFTGYLTGDPLPHAYAACDLFVFPSTNDTSGNVILEAQASGVPVIVTDRGGPQENLIPGETGYIVPADDADAMVRCICRLADDPARLQAMKEEARSYAAQRTEEACFKAFWDGYCVRPARI
jgi:glycosyltransferase involved in cell wall biosynthesis